MKSRQPPPAARVLVVKMSSLGDLFHALPAVHCIKAGMNARIDWVTHDEYVDVVRCFSDVDRVIGFPRRHFVGQAAPFIRDLQKEEYDVVLDLQGLLKSAAVAMWARGRRKIGPSYCREGSQWFYGELAGPLDKDRHAVEEALDTVRHLELPVLPPEFPVKFPRKKVKEPRPRVAILPCSRWPTKNWSAAKFAEVARGLRAQARASIFLFGSLRDGGVCAKIAEGVPESVNLCGKTSLVELAGYLQEMDLVVSVDTGPMHMAAAVGVPVLAVFGATDPKRTGPYGARHRVITTPDLDCRPCFSDECRRGDLACLDRVAAGAVAGAALEMLKSAGAS